MSPPTSNLFAIESIAGAGRGVIATKPIPKNALVLRSEAPAAHVIFHRYRKETCAQCFHYDRGRTLPARRNSAGKVFCSAECESKWLQDQGELGRQSWEQLQAFLRAKSKVIRNDSSLPLLAPRPDEAEIHAKWKNAEDEAKAIHRARLRQDQGSRDRVPKLESVLSRPWAQTVDADTLGFLLSGLLFHVKSPEQYQTTILPLAKDEQPYRSTHDLDAHTNSFLQLPALVPRDLLHAVTTAVCQTLIRAASHNSFGIRADGDEYMGYALYPEASYFNHSCRPGISKTRLGIAWEFRASRDIDVGEECCITYLGGDEEEMSVRQRRQRLREHWGFECMCVRCKRESGCED